MPTPVAFTAFFQGQGGSSIHSFLTSLRNDSNKAADTTRKSKDELGKQLQKNALRKHARLCWVVGARVSTQQRKGLQSSLAEITIKCAEEVQILTEIIFLPEQDYCFWSNEICCPTKPFISFSPFSFCS